MSRSARSVLCTVSLALALASGAAACSSTTATPASSRTKIQVVAAENFWGSIARQLGGKFVQVTSIITNPTADPHTYEPTPGDARTLAAAQLVIENGIGYDPWAPRLLAADRGHPTVLNVGDLVGVAEGGNPHRWYNPTDVHTVVGQIVADYQKLDPAHSSYFAQQASAFTTVALKQYDDTITAIRARYAGTPVGASESIFAMLSPALGLNLVTPSSFLKAISEGTDVSATDKQTIDQQIATHAIKIYVYNSQNVTPDVQSQLNAVKGQHIPYTTITETLTPPTTTYQAWQTKELLGIKAALDRASAGGA